MSRYFFKNKVKSNVKGNLNGIIFKFIYYPQIK